MIAASGGGSLTGTDIVLLGVVVLLIVLSGFLALAETALTRISRVKATSMVEEGRRRAPALLRLVEHMERTLPVTLFLLMLCNEVAATLVGVVTGDAFGALGVLIATVFEVVVIFVFAELTPKTWAVQHAERAALLSAPIISALVGFPPLHWLTKGLIAVSNYILPGKGMKEGPYVSEEELLAMADSAADGNAIEREERTLIHSIIDFGDTVVREVMVPRPDMVAVESTAMVFGVTETAIAAGYSRIPVVGSHIDDIVGIVFIKDLVRAEREGRSEETVAGVMRKPHFVPDSKKVSELMREMQARKFHMAVVVDEYGGTAGLVTLEDLIEELIGEIVDEYDVEEVAIERLADGEIRVSARMAIDEVNEAVGSAFPEEEDYDTVGGLVYGLLGHMPTEGESVSSAGYRLHAERVQGRRIGRVRIERLDVEGGDGLDTGSDRGGLGSAGTRRGGNGGGGDAANGAKAGDGNHRDEIDAPAGVRPSEAGAGGSRAGGSRGSGSRAGGSRAGGSRAGGSRDGGSRDGGSRAVTRPDDAEETAEPPSGAHAGGSAGEATR